MLSKDVNPMWIIETIIRGAFLNGVKLDDNSSLCDEEYEQIQMWMNCQEFKQAIAEIEAAAVERFAKERYGFNYRSEADRQVCVSANAWAESRRKEAQG